MKKTFTLLFVLTLLFSGISSAFAFPMSKSNESGDYLWGTGIAHSLSAGVYGGSTERDVKIGLSTVTKESEKAIVYMAVDLQPWLLLFGGIGGANHALGLSADSSAMQAEAGLLVNLVDHDILDPTLFEDKLRVNIGATWGLTQGEWFGEDIKWQELTAFATVSVVNDTVGNKFFNPNSIAIYVGPVFSYIQSEDIEVDQELGYMAGVEVFVSESISFDLGIRQFDGPGFEGGLHIRF
ncbi:MAG: hypothetical protein HQ523_04200 [Lentisphaerae bacterium]|nr:hypothetical protein [Lentisphaerota bacterium]